MIKIANNPTPIQYNTKQSYKHTYKQNNKKITIIIPTQNSFIEISRIFIQ